MELLPLPMKVRDFELEVLRPAMELLPEHLNKASARRVITTICLQESAFDTSMGSRWQVVDRRRPDVKGPARGLPQFELGGGVAGVYKHSTTHELARLLCHARDVRFDIKDMYYAMDRDDLFAVAMARLLLLTDPKPMPITEDMAWGCYLWNWRPGAYDRGGAKERAMLRSKWAVNWIKSEVIL